MKSTDLRSVLKKNMMTVVLVVVYIFFIATTNGRIFTPENFNNLIAQNAYVFILGVGMLMCMLTGGNIDLSCGSFVCVLGAVAGLLSVENQINKTLVLNTPLTLLIVFGIGIIYGVVLGGMIAFLKIPPWIATLAGYLAFRGLGTELLTKASATSAITNFPPALLAIFSGTIFKTDSGVANIPCILLGAVAAVGVVIMNIITRKNKIAKGYEADPKWLLLSKCIIEASVIMLVMIMLAFDGGIPVALIWVAVIMVIYGFVCGKTTIGRHFMTVGGNAETARLSGINNKLVMFGAYLNMAVLTVIASLLVTSRFQAANSSSGTNFEMDAISACIVGGVSAYGGAGTVMGMVIGATLIGVINLGMSLMGIDQNWQKVVKGVVLLAAVVFDILSKKGNKKQ